MFIRDLPLSETTNADCKTSGCPWVKEGLCTLTSEVLRRMAGLDTSTDEGVVKANEWTRENEENFEKFSPSCVLGVWNQLQLYLGELPRVLFLHAGELVQHLNNRTFAFNKIDGQLNVSSDEASQIVTIQKELPQFNPRQG